MEFQSVHDISNSHLGGLTPEDRDQFLFEFGALSSRELTVENYSDLSKRFGSSVLKFIEVYYSRSLPIELRAELQSHGVDLPLE